MIEVFFKAEHEAVQGGVIFSSDEPGAREEAVQRAKDAVNDDTTHGTYTVYEDEKPVFESKVYTDEDGKPALTWRWI